MFYCVLLLNNCKLECEYLKMFMSILLFIFLIYFTDEIKMLLKPFCLIRTSSFPRISNILLLSID